MSAAHPSDHKAEALRAAFDRSFAAAPDPGRAADLDFLAIRCGGERYALRLSEVASLHANRTLVLAPSLLPELLGLAAFRGLIVPVYDLAALLGYAAQPNARWLVLGQHESAIGFAFEAFDAQVRVTLDRVSAPAPGSRAYAQGAVQNGADTLPLLQLPTLIAAISRRITALGPTQER